MDDSKKLLIAEALERIVDSAKSGGPKTRVGLMASGSELGQAELIAGGLLAMQEHPDLQVVFIGPKPPQDLAERPGNALPSLEWLETEDCEEDIVSAIQKAQDQNLVSGVVALHYPFPIGVTTIGRILTPGRGRPMFIASCTGSSSALRAESLLRNAVYGLAVARASGIAEPTLAFLNLDGASVALRALNRMKDNGYAVNFGQSARSDGGSLIRGNDLVSGAVDVLVCDTLTGNALVKVFSTYTTGGSQEIQGWGYGPSVGEGWQQIVSIISRASAAPVIANALALTAKMHQGGLQQLVAQELNAAKAAGLEREIEDLRPKPQAAASQAALVTAPPAVPVGAQIAGVDVLDLDNAVQALWKAGIYAESAMGCTGPVVRVADDAQEKAAAILGQAGFI